jgi:hypothetical protein
VHDALLALRVEVQYGRPQVQCDRVP